MFLAANSHNLRRRIAIVGCVLIISPMLIVLLAGYLIFQRVEHLDRVAAISESKTPQPPSLLLAAKLLPVTTARKHKPSTKNVAECTLAVRDLWLLFGLSVASTGLAVRVWLQFADELGFKLSALIANQRDETKEPTAASNHSTRILQHLDASNAWVSEMLDAFDHLACAVSINCGEASGISVDERRALFQRCRQAARTAQSELRQSRAELQPANEVNHAEVLLRLAAKIDQNVAQPHPRDHDGAPTRL